MTHINSDFPLRELYEEVFRKKVCSNCIELDEEGHCQTEDPLGCALFRFLPELVFLANQLDDLKIQPYIQAVREHICVKCNDQKTGKCALRDALECGLDRYLSLVIEAIEEVNLRST